MQINGFPTETFGNDAFPDLSSPHGSSRLPHSITAKTVMAICVCRGIHVISTYPIEEFKRQRNGKEKRGTRRFH